MSGGYPAEADIDQFLTDRGVEIVTENNSNFIGEFKQLLFAILNRLDFAGALAVYCPSTTTFNVAGGEYLYRGEVKTYAPGSAVNPTDNDTTYVWLTGGNAIGSGIDGGGWPNTEHLKLAEIDVDSDGIITDVRDLRGRAFMSYAPVDSILDDIVTWDGDAVCFEGDVVYV
jgi:hypothetical protein